MSGGIHTLARGRERDALAYLARDPYQNVFLSWIISAERSSVRSSTYVYADASARISGVAFFGKQIVLAADNDQAIAAFAEVAPAYRFERMTVGPRSVVERYWERIRGWHAPPRAVRSSQPVFVVDAQALRRGDDRVHVRRASPAEWQAVAHNSAKMIEHELEYDPRSFSAEFNTNVRMMIDRGLWWVGEYEGRLCFFCNAGPVSAQTLQLQGIWTPPDLRGRGLARSALAHICAELLQNVPTISLYVNAFNTEAIALYERTGFRRAGEFQTLLF
jgi:RimJ/RimL family protein N-acetyltransferase